MITEDQKIIEFNPKNQLNLYGYRKYFELFVELYNENKLPKVILLNGPKGSGKATFAYHLINFFLSKNEEYSYNIGEFKINHLNSSYKKVNSDIHPNFYLIQNDLSSKSIKIDRVRDLLKFVTQTTYQKGSKIVMIDNIEEMNINSHNALLKSIEEPTDNTMFVLIHDNNSKIPFTIKSRCLEFKIFFNQKEKEEIFKKIIKENNIELDYNLLLNNLYFDTPGNLLSAYFTLADKDVNILYNDLNFIFHLIEIYKKDKNNQILNLITLWIEKFYNNLCLSKTDNSYLYFYNFSKIMHLINNMKKFNLNEKNIFISVMDILKYDQK